MPAGYFERLGGGWRCREPAGRLGLFARRRRDPAARGRVPAHPAPTGFPRPRSRGGPRDRPRGGGRRGRAVCGLRGAPWPVRRLRGSPPLGARARLPRLCAGAAGFLRPRTRRRERPPDVTIKGRLAPGRAQPRSEGSVCGCPRSVAAPGPGRRAPSRPSRSAGWRLQMSLRGQRCSPSCPRASRAPLNGADNLRRCEECLMTSP